MKVTAKATHAGEYWAVEVHEVDGAFTQARRLDQVPAMTADAVSLLEDTPASDIEVDVQIDTGDLAAPEEVRRSRAEVAAAAKASRAAEARLTRF